MFFYQIQAVISYLIEIEVFFCLDEGDLLLVITPADNVKMKPTAEPTFMIYETLKERNSKSQDPYAYILYLKLLLVDVSRGRRGIEGEAWLWL